MNEQNNSYLGTNGLLYMMPQSLSTTVNRTFTREQSQRQTYSNGDTVVLDLNVGSAYPDPEKAMLTFDLTCTATAGADNGDRVTFGTGTAANIIQEIRILSKNGCEVDRTQGVNILAKIRKDYMYNADGQKYLQMAGAGRVIGGATGLTNATEKFVIPMSYISGFFRPTVKGMKIPSGLGSGMRIEIILADPRRCFQRTAGTVTALTYTVSDPSIMMMLHELNDPTQAALINESAASGLEYTFPSYFETTITTAQTKVTEQVKKAVGQCTKVFATVYDLDGPQSVAAVTNDPVASMNSSELSAFQFRVGSQYYPQQTVSSDMEAWFIASSAFPTDASVGLTEYQTGGKFLLAHPLETDDRLNLAGIPLNNSNVLEFRLEMSTSINREYHAFIEFVTVAKTFINKTSIKI